MENNKEQWSKKRLIKELSDIHNFKKLFPDQFEQKSPKFHDEINEFLFKEYRQCAVGAPRGRGKTTGITFLQTLYRIAYRLENYIIVLSETTDKASKFIKNI